MTPDLKHCPGCGTDKLVTEFYRNKSRSDGLAAYCKTCDAAHCNRYRATEEAKAKNRERVRAYYKNNPDKKREHRGAPEKVREYSRQHYQKKKKDAPRKNYRMPRRPRTNDSPTTKNNHQ